MNNDPSLRRDISDVDDELRAPEAADTEGHHGPTRPDDTDTEGHVRFMLDEQGNPDVASPDDGEDTEGHKRRV